MDSFGELAKQLPTTEQLTTATNVVKATDSRQLTTEQVDRALEAVQDLISEEFKAWHARQVMRLGVSRYMGLASDARRGNKPAQYFSWLLRNAS